MRIRSTGLGFCVLLLSFWTVPLFAQIGVFQGIVKDKTTGQPIKDVVITIQGMDIKRKYELKTDKNGKYIHAGIPLQGLYQITAKKQGYQSDGVRGVKPGFGVDDQRGNISFELVPGQSGKLDFEMTEEELEQRRKEVEEAKKKQADLEALKQSFDQGLQLAKMGQHEQAIEAFKLAAQKDPDQPAVWANMGSSYAKLKQFDSAIESYNKAIALKPDDAALYQNLGGIYSDAGNLEKSKEMYEKAATLAVAADPKAAATQYYNIGVTYINSGNNAEAETALLKALEVDPNHAEAHYQLGLTQIGLDKMDEAVSHLKKYVELSPNGENAEVAKQLIEQLGGQK
ncbi:MAG TPA: tetratricopeptide repeat protein [Acidobacteriota bacterium]|nr:tetratricopeptide repeat protein [Acidobacteriota bacterium]